VRSKEIEPLASDVVVSFVYERRQFGSRAVRPSYTIASVRRRRNVSPRPIRGPR